MMYLIMKELIFFLVVKIFLEKCFLRSLVIIMIEIMMSKNFDVSVVIIIMVLFLDGCFFLLFVFEK